MGRVFGRGLAGVIALLAALPLAAHAGMPRGAIVSADEQDADPETGITIARGNAAISVEKLRILARADAIEINPAAKQIHFKGRALVTVGAQRYQGETVACTLDFNTCATGDAVAPAAPASALGVSSTNVAATQPSQQPLPPPAALGADAAVTSPR